VSNLCNAVNTTVLCEEVVHVVENLSAHSTLEDDRTLNLNRPLMAQLEHIAQVHGGRVPLHGRLFSQWLHFAFPRECPLPPKSGGAVTTITPQEFGMDGIVAAASELQQHATEMNEVLTKALESIRVDDGAWMSQWDGEEQLVAGFEQGSNMSQKYANKAQDIDSLDSYVVLKMLLVPLLLACFVLFAWMNHKRTDLKQAAGLHGQQLI